MSAAWITILAPLLGALLIGLSPAKAARWIALSVSGVALAAILQLVMNFPGWKSGLFESEANPVPFLPEFGITLWLGYDSVAIMLALLNAVLVPLCVLGSFSAIREREREYYAWFMVLSASIMLAFASRDAILFYIGYEFTLVPMVFLIAIWGGPERKSAATKYFLYTFFGSIFVLGAILWLGVSMHAATGVWNFDIDALIAYGQSLPASTQWWLFLCLAGGFAVKVPIFQLHTWLPLAHDQAPTGGSVILAGTLLKLGTYGIFRIALPCAPEGAVALAPFFAVLCVIAVVYASLICWVQRDVKRLIAYSSIGHLALCVLGLFAFNPIGAEGSVYYMVNHGISTGALFLCIGMVYERYHTKDMERLGGLVKRMPIWAFFMGLFTFASLGLPGLNGFVGEVLCLMGTFIADSGSTPDNYPGVLGPWYATVAASGLVLAAMYLLIMLGKIVWGPLTEPHDDHHAPSGLSVDLNWREIGVLAPLAVLCLWLGLAPGYVLSNLEPACTRMLAPFPAIVQAHIAADVQTAHDSEKEQN
ncbi:MAG: NADH-quinone oxidoreductase subunit M [Planctomycetota bacterium]|nr:NADH-quinone oxidoreductase subunit M [Planctomycetota bacterium]